MSAVAELNECGRAVTTSLAIAAGVEKEHKFVIRLVRDNLLDMEEFGRVSFENSPFITAGGMQRREVAILNEQQSTLLMTYMRNNDVVREFKKRLVKAFFELAEAASKANMRASSSLTHRTDDIVSADRVFRAIMRSAQTARLPVARSVLLGRDAALRETGIDLFEEFGLDKATAQHQALFCDGGVAGFVNAWLSGELPLPVTLCRSMDLYHAYLAWSRRNDGGTPLAIRGFWRVADENKGGQLVRVHTATSRLALPAGTDCPPLREHSVLVNAFREALDAYVLQPELA